MGKGGSTSSTVAVPEYIEKAARRNLTEADKISKLGFIPEYGPTVAAFTPVQEAAFQGTAQAAGAFGLPGGGMSMQDISGGMPEPTTYAGGVRGYSALPIYEQALEAFGQARPGQKRYRDSFFIDPVTGLPGSNMQAPVDYTVASTPGDLGGISAGGGGGDDAPYFPPVAPPVTPPVTPPVITPVTPQVDVPFTIPPVIEGPYVDDLTDGFDDSLSSNTPVLTTDDLRLRIEEEERLRQEDAQRRADELTALANSNEISIAEQIQLSGDNSTVTGSYAPGFSAEETNAAALDPRGVNQIPGYPDSGSADLYGQTSGVPLSQQDFYLEGNSLLPPGPGLFTGGGADAVGNFGQVGDFFGGIGDALGITNYSGTGGGLLGGLNVTGPVTPKSAAELQFEADRAPGGIHYESSGSQRREIAAAAAEKARVDELAQAVDTSEVLNLAKSKNSAQQWLKENGYGSYDRDDATDVLRSKVADIEKSQLQQGLKDGVVMENDRYSVYVNGQLVSSEKRSSEAKARLKAATS
jgi:hypothetical protein